MCFFLLPVQLFSEFVFLLVILSPPYRNEDGHGRGKRNGDPERTRKKAETRMDIFRPNLDFV